MFKMADLNMENQLDFLQTSVERIEDFHTLAMLINKTKGSVEELTTKLGRIMMEN